MADSKLDETVYISVDELSCVGETYGTVGVVVYSKTFNVNGIQTLIISG